MALIKAIMEELPIHLLGEIFWLPPHRPDKPVFPPETITRALAIFSSDFSTFLTVVFSYSADKTNQNFHKVRLNFAFADFQSIQVHTKNSEIILLDGYKVIAVVRDLALETNPDKKMGDKWIMEKT